MPDPTTAIQASPRVHTLLKSLHAQSAAQESSLSQTIFYPTRFLKYVLFSQTWSAASDTHMRDKFVALEEDKCHFMYLLARSIGARGVVEAGTSFGVSTIYLALAVGQNVRDLGGVGKVIATEKEGVKAARARTHWREAGEEVERWIELREGDLLETLKEEEGMPEVVDLLLLDIWTPLALPTLRIIKPRLRRGAIVLADNTSFASRLYTELLNYLRDPVNGFKTLTVPFKGGLEVSVYLPEVEPQ